MTTHSQDRIDDEIVIVDEPPPAPKRPRRKGNDPVLTRLLDAQALATAARERAYSRLKRAFTRFEKMTAKVRRLQSRIEKHRAAS